MPKKISVKALRAIELCKKDPTAYREIALNLGVKTNQIRVWAARAGIAIPFDRGFQELREKLDRVVPPAKLKAWRSNPERRNVGAK